MISMTKSMWMAMAAMASLGALAAADDIKVCEVIPASDVESTLGFKAARTQPGYRECTWHGSPGTFATAKGFVRYGHKIETKGYADAMKAAGVTVTVIDDKPDLWCAKLAMPGGVNAMECRVLTKGHYMELLATGPAITPEKARALLAKMSARLP